MKHTTSLARFVPACVSAVLLALATVPATSPLVFGTDTAHPFIRFDPASGELPEGVAVDATGDVFASLTTRGELVRIDADSQQPEVVSVIEGLADGDLGPIGLAVAADGTVYGGVQSANPDANGVWRLTGAGAPERIAGSGGIGLANDVALGPDGTLYVTDSVAGAVWQVAPGEAAELWLQDPLLAGTGEAGLGFPVGANGIAVRDGVVYVGVTEQAHVVAVPIEPDGSAGVPTLYAQLPEAVDGIIFEPDGSLISAHPLANQVSRLAPDGTLEIIADADQGLDRPSTLALWGNPDGSETLYVANFSVAMGTPLGAGPSITAIDLAQPTEALATATVEAGDLWFRPTELTITANGTTELELVNNGSLAHNLVINELGVGIVAGPGGSGSATLVDPPPGTYTFYCSIFGHRRAGMAGTLVVE